MLHNCTNSTAAFNSGSRISDGKVSSSGALLNSACIARGTQRYCPLALEYVAERERNNNENRKKYAEFSK